MASRHVISISMVSDFFKDHSAQLKRGEKSHESGYVASLHCDFEVEPPLIKGSVSASMKQRTYNVEMIIKDETICKMICSCPRGQDVCHHMASFALYCHYNISPTDKACVWNRPKSTSDDVCSIKEMFPAKPYVAVKSTLPDEKLDVFKEELRKCHVVGFSWLLRPEASKSFSLLVPDISQIVYSPEYLQAADKSDFFKAACKLTAAQICEVEEKTRGQARNENWLIVKKFRLTASKFGKVIDAGLRDKYPPSLFKSLIGSYNLEGVKAIQWGREQSAALEVFKQKTGLEVTPSGLWLHRCGFLGASPDGIINKDAILEIKCPYKHRNIDGPLKSHLKDTKYIISFNEAEEVVANTSHLYYHQMQGQLYLTNRQVCYLIIWTPNDSEIISIPRDAAWNENLDFLQNFYLQEFLEFLLK